MAGENEMYQDDMRNKVAETWEECQWNPTEKYETRQKHKNKKKK